MAVRPNCSPSRSSRRFAVTNLEQLDTRALLSDGFASPPVIDPAPQLPAPPPAAPPTAYPTAKPYDPTTDDGTGHNGYNPGKIVIPANFPRDQILIKPETGGGLQKVPPGNVTVPADAVYLPPGPGNHPGVVKVPDGHTVEVTYHPNGSWTWKEGPEQDGLLANFVWPQTVFPDEIGWPPNPLKPSDAQPPNSQP